MANNSQRIENLFGEIEDKLNRIENLIPTRRQDITNRWNENVARLQNMQDNFYSHERNLNEARQYDFLDPLQQSLRNKMSNIDLNWDASTAGREQYLENRAKERSLVDFTPGSFSIKATTKAISKMPWKFQEYSLENKRNKFFSHNPNEDYQYLLESPAKVNIDNSNDTELISLARQVKIKGNDSKAVIYAIEMNIISPFEGLLIAAQYDNEPVFDEILTNYIRDINKPVVLGYFGLQNILTNFLLADESLPLRFKYFRKLVEAGADINTIATLDSTRKNLLQIAEEYHVDNDLRRYIRENMRT